MAKRETDDEYYARTGELRDDDWGGPEETRPGFGETLSDEAQRALEDRIAKELLGSGRPGKGPKAQAARDADDARNADSAFNAILASATGTLLAPGVGAALFSVGTGAGAVIAYSSIVLSAAAATRIAWAKLSVQDRANVWRGGV